MTEICAICSKYLQKLRVEYSVDEYIDEWVRYGCMCEGRYVLIRFRTAKERLAQSTTSSIGRAADSNSVG